MGGIKRILAWVKPYRKKMIIGYALMVTGMALRVIMPYITALLVDDVIPERNLNLLYQLCGLLIGLTIVRGALTYTRGILFENVSQSVVYDLRTGLYEHMQELSSGFYDQHHIGEIMSRMTGDVEGIRNLCINGFLSIVENALMFVFALVGMAFMSTKLMLAMVVICPLIAVAAWKLNKVIRPAFKDIREQNAVLNTRTQENIAGVRVVKAFAHEEYEKQMFDTENTKVLEMNLNVTRIWSKYFPLMDMIAGMATPLMILVGGLLVLGGHMNVGELVGATGYVWMLVGPMRQVSSFVNLVTNGLVSSEKIVYYLDLGSLIRTPKNPSEPKEREGRIDFDHVGFRYGDTETLIDVDLHVQPGQTVAIMGATGTGKSTILALLGRYYDVSSGAVRVDGLDVRTQSLASLRGQIGAVTQETFLFSESIENNIRFGKPEASREDVERAAHIACADEFIHQMKDGYDTIVGERGLGLSGGQKQRVALARALLYDPSILVLDDATSAIDMETEAVIQARLNEANKRRTTLIIAHRISSVRHADLIVVLQHKTIAERGTHEELLARRGLYYQMFLDQTRDFSTVSGKAGE